MSRPGLPTVGPHVFVPPWGAEDRVTVAGEEGHHLTTVLRVRVGDPVSLADDSGLVAQGRVVGLDGARRSSSVAVAVESGHVVDAESPSISVVQGLPKGRKMDEVVQRLTEVGVDRLRPVVTQRTIKQAGEKGDRLVDRWRSIGLAAAQQSRRARTLVIDPISPWPAEGALGIVLWEDADLPLADAVAQVLADVDGVPEFAIAVGPEGGFTADEVERSGLVACRLGPTILRTETAGIVGATLVGEALGRYR